MFVNGRREPIRPARLVKPTIAAVLCREHSPHRALTPRVLREHPFACRFEDKLISGYIDRVVLWSSRDQIVAAEVFDFKTDSVPVQLSLAAKVETYRPQLESYRQAVTQLFGLPRENVSARLLFVVPDRVIEV